MYSFLRVRKYQPQLQKMDNETFKYIENFLAEQQAKVQYTPTDIHRTKIANLMLSHVEEPFHGCECRCSPFFLHGKLFLNDVTIWHHFNHDATMYSQPLPVCIWSNERKVFFWIRTNVPSSNQNDDPPQTRESAHMELPCNQAWYFAPSLKHYRVIKTTNMEGAVCKTDMCK